eukprot:ANDGO_01941.mRNA.1 hypothetical protein
MVICQKRISSEWDADSPFWHSQGLRKIAALWCVFVLVAASLAAASGVAFFRAEQQVRELRENMPLQLLNNRIELNRMMFREASEFLDVPQIASARTIDQAVSIAFEKMWTEFSLWLFSVPDMTEAFLKTDFAEVAEHVIEGAGQVIEAFQGPETENSYFLKIAKYADLVASVANVFSKLPTLVSPEEEESSGKDDAALENEIENSPLSIMKVFRSFMDRNVAPEAWQNAALACVMLSAQASQLSLAGTYLGAEWYAPNSWDINNQHHIFSSVTQYCSQAESFPSTCAFQVQPSDTTPGMMDLTGTFYIGSRLGYSTELLFDFPDEMQAAIAASAGQFGCYFMAMDGSKGVCQSFRVLQVPRFYDSGKVVAAIQVSDGWFLVPGTSITIKLTNLMIPLVPFRGNIFVNARTLFDNTFAQLYPEFAHLVHGSLVGSQRILASGSIAIAGSAPIQPSISTMGGTSLTSIKIQLAYGVPSQTPAPFSVPIVSTTAYLYLGLTGCQMSSPAIATQETQSGQIMNFIFSGLVAGTAYSARVVTVSQFGTLSSTCASGYTFPDVTVLSPAAGQTYVYLAGPVPPSESLAISVAFQNPTAAASFPHTTVSFVLETDVPGSAAFQGNGTMATVGHSIAFSFSIPLCCRALLPRATNLILSFVSSSPVDGTRIELSQSIPVRISTLFSGTTLQNISIDLDHGNVLQLKNGPRIDVPPGFLTNASSSTTFSAAVVELHTSDIRVQLPADLEGLQLSSIAGAVSFRIAQVAGQNPSTVAEQQSFVTPVFISFEVAPSAGVDARLVDPRDSCSLYVYYGFARYTDSSEFVLVPRAFGGASNSGSNCSVSVSVSQFGEYALAQATLPKSPSSNGGGGDSGDSKTGAIVGLSVAFAITTIAAVAGFALYWRRRAVQRGIPLLSARAGL